MLELGAARCSKYYGKLMALTIMKGVAGTTPVLDSIIIRATDCNASIDLLHSWRGTDSNTA
jgi:hypothetical protein